MAPFTECRQSITTFKRDWVCDCVNLVVFVAKIRTGMNLRSDSKDTIVHRLEYRSLSEGIRLPTNQSIIARCLCLREENKLLSSKDIFKMIVSEVKEIWDRDFIPIKVTNSVLFMITSIHHKWDSMKKYGSRLTQPTDQLNKKMSEFQIVLNQLFDIADGDAFEKLKASRRSTWKEDWEFLVNQRNSRTGYMGGVDHEATRFEMRRARRLKTANQARQSALNDNEIENLLSDISEERTDEFEDVQENYLPILNKRKQATDNACLIVPTNKLLEATSEVSDRCGLSIRDQLFVTSRLVNVGGGNIEDFSLSVSSAWRQRNSAREQIAEKIKEKWLEEKPKFAVVHWDSKMMSFFSGKKEERVAILVSGALSGYLFVQSQFH